MRTLWVRDTYGICKARTCTAATPSISSIILLAAHTLSFSSAHLAWMSRFVGMATALRWNITSLAAYSIFTS